MNEEPNYDSCVSYQANDLLKLLLHKDVDRRIKPEQIPYHPWFNGINFNDIKNIKVKSPFIPTIVR